MPECTTCQEHQDVKQNERKTWEAIDRLSDTVSNNKGRLAVLCAIGVAVVAYCIASFASNDRVNAVDQRVSDVKEAMMSGFDRMDAQQERMSDKIDRLLRVAGDK